MLMIRLARIGKKKQPIYRVVVSEKARDMYGKALEIIGHYNPGDKKFEVKADRINYWLSKGAKASETMHNLLVANKVISGKKVKVTHISKKKQEKLAKKAEKTDEKATKTENTPEPEAQTEANETPETKPEEKKESSTTNDKTE